MALNCRTKNLHAICGTVALITAKHQGEGLQISTIKLGTRI